MALGRLVAFGRLVRLCGAAAVLSAGLSAGLSASLLAGAGSARAEASVVRLAKQFGMLTLIAVATSMVLFRSPTGVAASELLRGMIGMNGISLPQRGLPSFGQHQASARWFQQHMP